MKYAMISQPMRDKTDVEISLARSNAECELLAMGYMIVNTLFDDEWYDEETMLTNGVLHTPVAFLAKSINAMSRCDAVYFCKGWESARGCKIEHQVAHDYGLTIIYEK